MKKKFLIVGETFDWTSGAFWLQEKFGCDVRVFCSKPDGKNHLKNMVKQVTSLSDGLRWLGKDGRFIREDEKDVTPLRKMGFSGVGGNKLTERMENDRVFEMEIAKSCGIDIPNYHAMKSVDEGITFIKKHPDQYCIKQMGHSPKSWNFVGKHEDGSDAILQLEWIKEQPEFKKMSNVPFMIQEYGGGIELATAGWWIGKDWLRDKDNNIIIEVNKEHKKQGNGDTGQSTWEMGTVMKFDPDAKKLFDATLSKLTPWLKKNCPDIVLNIDANCGIVDGKPWLYEHTLREGYPACALQQWMLETPLDQFLADMIDRKQGTVKFKDTWGVIAVLGAGTFPYEPHGSSHHEGSFNGQPVMFPDEDKGWDEHIAPFFIGWNLKKKIYEIQDDYEWVCGVTFDHKDMEKANEQCVKTMQEIEVRAPQYRTDIGLKFKNEELPKLEKMGFL